MWVPTDKPFTTTEPRAVSQVAVASAPRPPRSFTITAVPFGTSPGTEAVPIAKPNAAKTYHDAIRAYRAKYEIEFEPNGPAATLFGQKVSSQVTLAQLRTNTEQLQPTLIVEWVVEAGQRIWIIRIVKQLPDGTKDLSGEQGFLKSLEELTISSDTLDNPTTLSPAIPNPSGTRTIGAIPGMPNTGAASAAGGTRPALPTLFMALLAGLLALSGVALRAHARR